MTTFNYIISIDRRMKWSNSCDKWSLGLIIIMPLCIAKKSMHVISGYNATVCIKTWYHVYRIMTVSITRSGHMTESITRNHTQSHAITRNHTQPQLTKINYNQSQSITINHNQPQSTTINHTQPHSTTLNHTLLMLRHFTPTTKKGNVGRSLLIRTTGSSSLEHVSDSNS